MAKTVADKLLIKPETSVWSSDEARMGLLGPLPDGVSIATGLRGATTAVVFAPDAASVRSFLTTHQPDLGAPINLWILYPKGNKADINRDSLWPIVADYGLRPITQVAVDDTWSALRFRPLKEDEAPFTGGR